MDINNFGPFNSDVWGNVSSWTVTFITALTAWFLWRTLKSQNKVLESQQKTLQSQSDQLFIQKELWAMEAERFKSEIPLIFNSANAKLDSTSSILDENSRRIVSFTITNVFTYPVYDVTFRIKKNNWRVQEPYMPIKTMHPGDVYTVLFNGKIDFTDDTKASALANDDTCNIEIYYNDIKGSYYRHTVYYNGVDKHSFPMGKPAGVLKDLLVERVTKDARL